MLGVWYVFGDVDRLRGCAPERTARLVVRSAHPTVKQNGLRHVRVRAGQSTEGAGGSQVKPWFYF